MLTIGIFLGLAVLLNFVSILYKLQRGNYIDALVDAGLIIVLTNIYGTSLIGGVIATIGSAFISIFLILFPITVGRQVQDTVQSSLDKALDDILANMKEV